MSMSQTYANGFELFDKSQINNNASSTMEQIKLGFSIENTDEGNYSVQAKLYEGQANDFFSGIKVCYTRQAILHFDNFFICNFIFGKQQNIEITFKKDNKETKLNCTLGGIVGARNSTLIYKFPSNESLIIKAEKKGTLKDVLEVKFAFDQINLQKLFKYFGNQIYYVITSNNEKLCKSAYMEIDGTFEPIYIPICLLTNSYKVSFYNSNNYKIFSFDSKIEQISSKKQIQLKNNEYIFFYDLSKITKNFSFIDYIQAGVRIALSIGIDFTASNGHPKDAISLHNKTINQLNDYEKAILACGNIVGYYDYDQLFPVFGFGAKIKPNNVTSMCFNLNFSDNPDIKTIDNILKVYRNVLQKDLLEFSTPTYFAPLIREVKKRINKNNALEYHILMILTDGIIEDKQETIDELVEASLLPLSLIIIGIGKNTDFKMMEDLDGDEEFLVSSKGQIRKRDIVQFVPFEKYAYNPQTLAMEVLAEIPKQIVEYYRFKNLDPEQIKKLTSKNNGLIFNAEYYSAQNFKKNTSSNNQNLQSTTNSNNSSNINTNVLFQNNNSNQKNNNNNPNFGTKNFQN